MKLSGFAIIKNAIHNDYPIVEAIQSILPVVDEMIVLVGDSKDDTRSLIASIGSEKIKIFDSVWDYNLRTGGTVLSVETNKALKLIDPESTWAFYIQGDEVVHEKYLDNVKKACLRYKDDLNVDGLLFDYTHFYANYNYVGVSRMLYPKEVRIIRNHPKIQSYKDAQGFRIGEAKIKVKKIAASIYHYGWVKTPIQMRKKINEVTQYWHQDSEEYRKAVAEIKPFEFETYLSVKEFKGTHPAVLQARIAEQALTQEIDNRKNTISFKDRILLGIEQITG